MTDGERLLNGDALLPFWRSPQGINVGKLFDNLPSVHLDEWIQGRALLPYLEDGEIVSTQSLQAFSGAFPGSAGLMAFWLN